ncbi:MULTISPECIES: hypothetical protein [Microbacterium]|jgi:hypothetical protein|uniref:hypothetical protein n=1 Tax=Microbacterium TaxID=33882 RepID=UPI001D176A7B|nr:hypothetical protein [Microbacterium testaceum]MCC4248514.1 hypothetical protein [Microbacterium testaceum]
MASLRALTGGLSTLGLSLALTACVPSVGAGGSDDRAYETVIAAVIRAESDAGGRAFDVEIEDGTAQVHVAVDGRDTEVDVELAGPTVTERHDDGDLDADDRTALDAASTTLADGIRIAAAAHGGGGDVSEVDLARGDDAAWRVEFTDGTTIAVAVSDGTVVRAGG